MKIKIDIGYGKLIISEEHISDVYYIEKYEDKEKFYIYSYNGYSSYGIVDYDLDKAILHVKKLIKNYFLDRGEENPKGF